MIIRSLALKELKLGEWWRVFGRELKTGLALGIFLGVIGFLRIGAWQGLSHMPVVGSFFATESEQEKAKIPGSFVMVDAETELKTPLEVPGYTLPEGTRLRRGTFLPVSAQTKEKGIWGSLS